ncbi:MAG: hypothetical protein RR595_02195 [Lysinibacillus sp.]
MKLWVTLVTCLAIVVIFAFIESYEKDGQQLPLLSHNGYFDLLSADN